MSEETNAPTAEQIESTKRQIQANFNNKVDVKEVKFHFKKVKDEASGIETKRPSVELYIPTPSVEGIISIIETGGKGLDLLLEAAGDIVIARAREIINEREGIDQSTFPMDSLTWESIANLPKAERRGGGIAKELWEEFAKDYIAVMPSVTGKSTEQVTNAAKLYIAKFNPVKTNKPVLRVLKEQLGMYLEHSPNAGDYSECVEFLTNKADNLLNMDEASLLANL